MSIDAKNFKRALGKFASGVTVITVRSPDGEDHGMTASAFSSLSLDPPLVLVCIKNENQTYELIEKAGSFAVNILGRHQEAESNRFAGGYIDAEGHWQRWPEGRDKFEDLVTTRGEVSGAALIEGSLARLDCRLEHILAGGDHGIFVGRVEGAQVLDSDDSAPLLYFGGRYGGFQP